MTPLITVLVRLRHLIATDQMNKEEIKQYLDNAIKAWEDAQEEE